MHRLITVAAALAVLGGAVALDGSADARQRKKQREARPPPEPRVILRDRFYNPPQQPERNYYGPAPSMQPPMERVPLPAPLAQPPINR